MPRTNEIGMTEAEREAAISNVDPVATLKALREALVPYAGGHVAGGGWSDHTISAWLWTLDHLLIPWAEKVTA